MNIFNINKVSPFHKDLESDHKNIKDGDSLDNAQKLTQETDEIESLIIYLDSNDELKSFISEGFQEFIF